LAMGGGGNEGKGVSRCHKKIYREKLNINVSASKEKWGRDSSKYAQQGREGPNEFFRVIWVKKKKFGQNFDPLPPPLGVKILTKLVKFPGFRELSTASGLV